MVQQAIFKNTAVSGIGCSGKNNPSVELVFFIPTVVGLILGGGICLTKIKQMYLCYKKIENIFYLNKI